MPFIKRDIICKAVCLVFLLVLCACHNRKEEQLNKDLAFIKAQSEKFLEMENIRSQQTDEKLNIFYRRGFDKQHLIKKWNTIQSVINTKLKERKHSITPDTSHHATLNKLKSEIEEILQQEKHYIIRGDGEELIRYLDSCTKANTDLSPELQASAQKLELLVFKNKVNLVFFYSCSMFNNCNWGWTPFFNSVFIKNYQQNGKSFLEINFPTQELKTSLRQLRLKGKEGNDTLALQLLKIIPGMNAGENANSSHLKIDLSALKHGQYSMDVCVILITPQMESSVKTEDAEQHCKTIEFEVFQ